LFGYTLEYSYDVRILKP